MAKLFALVALICGALFAAGPVRFELRDTNGALIAENDDCSGGPLPVLPPESCIESSLPSGAFTAILAGKNGGTGVGLVEVYNVH